MSYYPLNKIWLVIYKSKDKYTITPYVYRYEAYRAFRKLINPYLNDAFILTKNHLGGKGDAYVGVNYPTNNIEIYLIGRKVGESLDA